MSRKSLLDEAIAKAKESEDWQLVEWLRMARGGESAARWYSDKLREAHRTERKLLDENAKLRHDLEEANNQAEEVCIENAKLRDEIDQWHRLTAGIELPEYPITEFQPKDLERENAKLRELVWDMCEWAYIDSCCDLQGEFADRMRELGVGG